MPVLPEFYISHQWLRELKRSGAKTIVGVYFKLDSKTLVYAGKYNEEHRQITLGEAIREIMSLADPRGYELIIDRKISSKEIQRISRLPQNVGWRYFPGSHGRRPCPCPICSKGMIKGKRSREKAGGEEKPERFGTLLNQLRRAFSPDDQEEILLMISNKRTRSNPQVLFEIIKERTAAIDQALAMALRAFRHPSTRKILNDLLESNDDETRENAAYSLLRLYGKEECQQLLTRGDSVIGKVIQEWEEEKNIKTL